MTFFHRALTTTALAVAALGLTSVAHAGTVFDGSSWTTTTSFAGGAPSTCNGVCTSLTSSTTAGATTLSSTGAALTDQSGSDWVNLATPITANSGVWTLNATVSASFPGDPTQAHINLGFASGTITNSAVSVENMFQGSGGSAVNPLTGPNIQTTLITANSNTSFHVGDGTSAAGGPITNMAHPTTTDPTTYTIILNTNQPQWTVEFLINGTPVLFNSPNGPTDELLYATNPQTLTQFGIGLEVAGTSANTVTSATFSDISLTDDTGVTAAVPEPSTWAMMVLGFAGLGFMAYRRRDRKGGLNFRLA